MDDVKLFTKSDKELEELLNIVKRFSYDKSMVFRLDKCTKTTFKAKKKKIIKAQNIELNTVSDIQNLDESEVYKYLVTNEGDGIQHFKMKEKIRMECYRRVSMILNSELNADNRINTINSLAI